MKLSFDRTVPFNRTILNDIRPHVVANLDKFDLTNLQLNYLIDTVYQAFIDNDFQLSFEQASLEGEIKDMLAIERIKSLYSDYLYLMIAAYAFHRMNNLPMESRNMILAYGNILGTSEPNACTFERTSDSVKELRMSLEKRFAIAS